jgi:hypothetical protein
MILHITRQKAMELCGALAGAFTEVKNTKFAYALQKNIRKIKPIEDELNKILSPSDEIKEFERLRVEICTTFAQKDADLKPIVKNGHYEVSPDRKEAFEKEIETLKLAHGTAIKEHKWKQEKVQKLMEEEIDFEVMGIKNSNLPGDLTLQQLDILEPLIIGG